MPNRSSSPSVKDNFSDSPAVEEACEAAENALSDVTILICQSCRPLDEASSGQPQEQPRPGSVLASRTIEAAAKAGVRIQPVECLGNCNRGLSVGFMRKGSWSYIFGELDTDSADDLIEGAKLFASSPNGFMPFRGRPDALKGRLIARIPSSDSLKDLP